MLLTLAGSQLAVAQDLQAIARIDVAKSNVSDRLLGGVSVKLSLSQAVPFRVFTLDAPIVNGIGKLNIGDTTWKVVGEDLPAQARVRVTGVDGTVLTVEPA